MSESLHRMLDASLQLPPEYGGGLSSHLPMALHALERLGADAARLRSFFDRYARRFDAQAAPVAAAPVADVRPLYGRADAFSALRATFQRRIADAGRDAVLQSALPGLLPGIAAAAFHGAIRTAHAVESGHDAELAAALAYWAWRWQPLHVPPAAAPLAFDDWSAALVAAARRLAPQGRLISLRMQQVETAPAYLALAAALRPAADRLPQLAALAADRYAATGNFTVLHMVTALTAVRVLLPWIADEDAAMAHVVRACTAAYLVANAGPDNPPPPAQPWPAIVPAAIASDDDHVIKLVQACRDQEAACGGDRWRVAATVAVLAS